MENLILGKKIFEEVIINQKTFNFENVEYFDETGKELGKKECLIKESEFWGEEKIEYYLINLEIRLKKFFNPSISQIKLSRSELCINKLCDFEYEKFFYNKYDLSFRNYIKLKDDNYIIIQDHIKYGYYNSYDIEMNIINRWSWIRDLEKIENEVFDFKKNITLENILFNPSTTKFLFNILNKWVGCNFRNKEKYILQKIGLKEIKSNVILRSISEPKNIIEIDKAENLSFINERFSELIISPENQEEINEQIYGDNSLAYYFEGNNTFDTQTGKFSFIIHLVKFHKNKPIYFYKVFKEIDIKNFFLSKIKYLSYNNEIWLKIQKLD